MTVLWQVTAPHFCAGMVTAGDRCTLAAPILAWTIGKTRDELRTYFWRKKWLVVCVRREG